METIYVDVVEKGRALVIHAGHEDHNGYASRNGKVIHVFDDETGLVGFARTYERAGHVLATHWGVDNPTVKVDREV